MIVCSCRAVSDTTLRTAIAEGASTLEDIAERCGGAGSCCGACRPAIAAMLHPAESLVRQLRARDDAAARTANAHCTSRRSEVGSAVVSPYIPLATGEAA